MAVLAAGGSGRARPPDARAAPQRAPRLARRRRDATRPSSASPTSTGRAGSRVRINELILALADLLERRTPALDPSLTSSERTVELFLARLEDELERPWTLDTMAAECGLGRTRFAHYCERLTNVTAARVPRPPARAPRLRAARGGRADRDRGRLRVRLQLEPVLRDRLPALRGPRAARPRPACLTTIWLCTASRFSARSHVPSIAPPNHPDGSGFEGGCPKHVQENRGIDGGGGRARADRRGSHERVAEQQHGQEAHEGRDPGRRARASRGAAGDRRRQRRQPRVRAARLRGLGRLRRRAARGRRLRPAGAGVQVRLLRGELRADPRLARTRGRSSTAPTSSATRSTPARPRARRPARCSRSTSCSTRRCPANSQHQRLRGRGLRRHARRRASRSSSAAPAASPSRCSTRRPPARAPSSS